ncbi:MULTISPECIES: quinone-dependent dihydroorotate dehydrogenase [unclassified Halobacteriovorax]|uniref:quinone-dependent dihydroorotate dehydrogenase n=1 Tax=unclassified Halobacteriovorax TaxID=2639665 RepID=UPI000EA14C6E|nr:quinone-dependent dihydroorotate dehydrogenase [Halobacteriovorax sp. BALOs_7]AYF44207.1 dihydroorotate dehydrogenase (fumarate) [Halobacteriovorax sp. BALOs_7]
MVYSALKSLLFKLDAEDAHDLTIKLMESFPLFASLFNTHIDPKTCLKVGNLTWKSPVGLAAGLDKNARAYEFLSQVGFGAIEVGTVTPRPQIGNERPRLFRYIEEESIRNCMGFNNLGSDFMYQQVLKLKSKGLSIPLGVNIGKNKTTPDEEAPKDYGLLYQKFKDIADYIVINVSSPNTPGLRSHQTKDALEKLFKALDRKEEEVDLYLKIAPDIEMDEIDAILETAAKFHLTGIIATNTTIMPERGVGGISGKLLYKKAHNIRKACLEKIKNYPSLEFIGVGGFASYNDVVEYWRAGGRALQIYSAFIFQGPKLLSSINESIQSDLARLELKSIDELINYYQRKAL